MRKCFFEDFEDSQKSVKLWRPHEWKPLYFLFLDLRAFFVEEALILHFSGIYLTLSFLFEKSSSCLQMHHVVQSTTTRHVLRMLGMCVIRPTLFVAAARCAPPHSATIQRREGGHCHWGVLCMWIGVCYVCGLGWESR